MESDLTKKYYKIGDVARITGLPVSTIRFWERELGIFSPRRNDRGTRFYTPDDVETIRIVSYLVHDKGMRLEAAREQLRANRGLADRRAEAIARLLSLRERLQALLDALPSGGYPTRS